MTAPIHKTRDILTHLLDTPPDLVGKEPEGARAACVPIPHAALLCVCVHVCMCVCVQVCVCVKSTGQRHVNSQTAGSNLRTEGCQPRARERDKGMGERAHVRASARAQQELKQPAR